MNDKITKQKLDKYYSLTKKALEIAKKSVVEEKKAKEIIRMASDYLSDAKHFSDKDDFVNAFAAVNYAHGWLDAGVRLGVFDIKDDKLFTVK